MKRTNLKLVFIYLSCVSVGFGGVVATKTTNREETNPKTYHLKMAAYYEKKAREMDFIIGIHREMRNSIPQMVMHRTDIPVDSSRDLEKKTWNVERGMPPIVHSEMEKHCNAIIHNAERLKKDYEDFAKWHREQAALEKNEEKK